jgi:hypothetical protein
MFARSNKLKQFVLGAAVVGAASFAFAEDQPVGEGLFVKNKCNTCHAVASAGIEAKRGDDKAPDMSNAGASISSADWAFKFVMREESKDGKKHRRPYKGSEKDLKAIVDWLVTLKTS